MITKVAWRNIWRHKVRSLVVIMAIALGLWAGVFASAFVVGMMDQKIDNVIRLEMSHFQFHHPEFNDELLPKFTILNADKVIEAVSTEEPLSGISSRVVAMSMLGSANKSGALKVTGISPEDESLVTDIHDVIVEGQYFKGVKRNPILISSKTAQEYKAKVRSKLVITVNDLHGEITAGAFRMVGIYDSKNPLFDKMNAFVLKEDLQQLLGIGEEVHEVAVLLSDHAVADILAQKYQAARPDLKVQSWMDLASGMRLMVETIDIYAIIIVSIILVVLLFSIVNTMLMAVLERVREIGMLMAVGMSKAKVFRMIMLETVFLSLIGGPLGLFIAWGSINYFGKYGIDLGDAAYSDYGFRSIIYPALGINTYIQVTVMVLIMALLAALYPARKTLKLNPVEAIRKI